MSSSEMYSEFNLNSISKFLFSDGFITGFVSSKTLYGKFGFDMGGDYEFFQCVHSLLIDNSTNVIKFKSKHLEFLVFQHVSSSDFVYFQNIDIFKYRCHVNKEIADKALVKYHELLNKFDFDNSKERLLSGLISSHGRPAHFFYDTVLGVQSLYEAGLLSNQTLYQMPGAQFVKLNEVFKDVNGLNSETTSYENLNELSLETGGVFFKVGGFYGYGDSQKDSLLSVFDSKLVNFATTIKNQLVDELKDLKSKGFYLLWHGITTDKRRWIEQDGAIIKLISKLESLGRKVCLIVDGWTSPINKTSGDERQIVNDSVIFEKIKLKLSSSVVCTSIIGELPVTKVAIATLIDAHITNGGTGSIYPSRFARKKGVMHIANQSRKMTEQHIHFNSIFVPEFLITDRPDPEHPRDDYISYSINSEIFCDFAIDYLINDEYKIVYLDKSFNCMPSSEDEKKFKAINDDPMLFFKIDISSLSNKNKCFFEVNIITDLPLDLLKPKLYIDYGLGFSEKDSIVGKYDSNYHVKFEIPEISKLKVLRFDPFEVNGDFFLDSYDLTVDKN